MAFAVARGVVAFDHHQPCDPDVPCLPDWSPHQSALVAALAVLVIVPPLIAMLLRVRTPLAFGLPALALCWVRMLVQYQIPTTVRAAEFAVGYGLICAGIGLFAARAEQRRLGMALAPN